VEIGGTGGALNWSCDGAYLGSAQEDKIIIYSADGLVKIFEYALPYASDVAFSPLRDVVAFGSWQGGVVLPMEAITSANCGHAGDT
jgi:hypothetical protein